MSSSSQLVVGSLETARYSPASLAVTRLAVHVGIACGTIFAHGRATALPAATMANEQLLDQFGAGKDAARVLTA